MSLREVITKVPINPIVRTRTRHSPHAYLPTRDNIEIANRCLQNVAQFRYLGTIIRNQRRLRRKLKEDRIQVKLATIQSKIFCLLVCLPKNLKITIYKTVILPVVLYGCETWSLTLNARQAKTGYFSHDDGTHQWPDRGTSDVKG
jgi:hypothetical protein